METEILCPQSGEYKSLSAQTSNMETEKLVNQLGQTYYLPLNQIALSAPIFQFPGYANLPKVLAPPVLNPIPAVSNPIPIITNSNPVPAPVGNNIPYVGSYNPAAHKF